MNTDKLGSLGLEVLGMESRKLILVMKDFSTLQLPIRNIEALQILYSRVGREKMLATVYFTIITVLFLKLHDLSQFLTSQVLKYKFPVSKELVANNCCV